MLKNLLFLLTLALGLNAVAAEKCSSIDFLKSKRMAKQSEKDLIEPVLLLMNRNGVSGKTTLCGVIDDDGYASVNLLLMLEVASKAKIKDARLKEQQSGKKLTEDDVKALALTALNETLTKEEWDSFKEAMLFSLGRVREWEKAKEASQPVLIEKGQEPGDAKKDQPENKALKEVLKFESYLKSQDSPLPARIFFEQAKALVELSQTHSYTVACKVADGDVKGWSGISFDDAFGIDRDGSAPGTTIFTPLDGLDDSCDGITGNTVSAAKAIAHPEDK